MQAVDNQARTFQSLNVGKGGFPSFKEIKPLEKKARKPGLPQAKQPASARAEGPEEAEPVSK